MNVQENAELHTQSIHFSNIIRRMLAQAWAFNRTLTLAIVLNLALIPIILVLAVFDPVTITGVNGWIKPLKFTSSIAIYSATFLWFLTYVRRGKFWVGVVASLTGAMLLGEIALVMMQVARRTTSHFNVTTLFDELVFSVMGIMIMLVALVNLVVAIWLVLQKMDDKVIAAGLRWGVWITFAGMIVATLMLGPSAVQREQMQAGIVSTAIGAHSVGVPDGGAGLPILGWSTEGGDIRVGHFVGLHALQMLPLLAWLLKRAWTTRRWSERQRLWLLHVGGFSYLSLMALLTWQALRGQSLIAPDALTLAAFGLLAGSALIVVLLIVRRTDYRVNATPAPRIIG